MTDLPDEENVGRAIENMPEHWDTTGDPSEDTGRVSPSRSLWTEPRWPVDDCDGLMELAHLSRCLRFWLSHEPRTYDPADLASLDGVRRLEPLTPEELCEALDIIDAEQVAVVAKLATSRWYESRTGTDWYRGCHDPVDPHEYRAETHSGWEVL